MRGFHNAAPFLIPIVLLLVLQYDGRIAGMLCRREVGVLSGMS